MEIKNARPPRSTTAAFKDVINAQEEMTELIHQAESYRNRIIPEAKAEVAEILQKAQAYRNEKIAQARGEAKSFLMLADEYEKQPVITRERLRVDAVRKIFPGMRKLISDTDSRYPLVNLKVFQNSEGS